jgi:hypothetical protein
VVQQSGGDGIRVGQSDDKCGLSPNFPNFPYTIQQSSGSGMAFLQRAPAGGPDMPSTPLEVVARRTAELSLGPHQAAIGAPRGPVLTVVRDKLSGEIFVGLNTGIPKNLTDVLYKGIEAQKVRISSGEVRVVHTDPLAVGGHSEINALNSAIRAREMQIGRKVTKAELGTFELHNVWLSGPDRRLTAAPRCEHCARIAPGVSVTQSVFFAEGGVAGEITGPQRGRRRIPRVGPGGVAGEITVPQRGSVTPSGGGPSRPVTTTSGEVTVPQRGSVTPSGGGPSKAVTTASGEITVPQPKGGFRAGLRAALSAKSIAAEIPGVVLDRVAVLEAIRGIQVKFTKEGFAKGVAAGVTGWSEEEVRLNLKNRITSYRVRGLEDPAGFLTKAYILQLAEAYENHAVDLGYQFSSSHTLKWKKDILAKGFAVLAKYGYYFGEDPQVLFEYDFIKKLAETLHPITNPIVEEAIDGYDGFRLSPLPILRLHRLRTRRVSM